MGPPIYIGGNKATLSSTLSPSPGFNGATDLHRWKLGHALDCTVKAFRLQWGHRFTSVETPRVRRLTRLLLESFNGATDLHRWKRIGLVDGCGCHSGFNGATDLHRWKPTGSMAFSPITNWLQWGHRFTSVETNSSVGGE